MTDRTCATCGQPQVAARGTSVVDIALTPLTGEPVQPDPVGQFTPVVSDDGREGGVNGWLLALLTVVVLAVGFVVLRADGDDSPGGDATDTTDDAASPVVTVGPFDREVTFATPEEVDAQSALLSGLIGENRLAYLAAGGVVVVDLEAGNAPTAEFSPESFNQLSVFEELSDFVLLSEGDTTYGIKRSELVVHQLSNSGRLVPTEKDGIFSITSDPAEVWSRMFVATSAGFFMADLAVPRDSTYVNISGLGTLVSPPTGGTFLAGIEGFEPFSDHRVIAGTPEVRVELRCGDFTADCLVVLADNDENWKQLPDALAGETGGVSVSPDGRWILVTNSGSDAVADTERDRMYPIAGDQPKGEVTWSPDSKFAVWFEPSTNEPLLQVLYPEQQVIESVDLGDLGAADRVGDSIVVFS